MNNVDLIHFEGLRELPKENEPVKYEIRLSFRLSDEFADAVRKISQRTPEDLDKRLSRSVPRNRREYGFIKSDMEETIVIVRKILEICNCNTVDYLLNYLITNNGRKKGPADIHRIIKEEYGITEKWEWEVAHFFIQFDDLIFTIGDQDEFD